MNASNYLTISSYNCKLFSDSKLLFIKKLLSSSDFVCIQEHGLYKTTLSNLCKIDENINYTGTSAMNEYAPLIGRPHGGCAIIWKSNIKCKVSEVSCTSKRLCAILLELDTFNIIIFCLYMPCDTKCQDANSDEYSDVLNEVNTLVSQYNVHHYVLAGDFNTDLSRNNSMHTSSLNRYLYENDCEIMTRIYNENIKYTYISAGDASIQSIIDHVVVSKPLHECVCKYEIFDDADNLSDHVAIMCSFEIPVDYAKTECKISSNHVNWKIADECDILNYQNELNIKLQSIKPSHESYFCSDLKCDNSTHIDVVGQLYGDIVTCCLRASDCTIPYTNHKSAKGKRCLPGWNDIVKPERERALFWHHIWRDSGSPRTGLLADIRRKTRAAYHYAIKRARKQENVTMKTKLADASNGSSKDFWNELKRIKGCNKVISSKVDGSCDSSDICDIFVNKFSELYNISSQDDTKETLCTIETINERVNLHCCNLKNGDNDNLHMHAVTVQQVKDAVKCLKPLKRDGTCDMYTNHIIHGNDRLFVLLSMLFSLMLVHGKCPTEMVRGTMIPIPKCKGASESDKFRAITLSSVIAKLFDIIVLQMFKNKLYSCNLQFGFKENSSTATCTFLVQEVISYYNEYGSNVFCTMLDASKAFDCVRFHTLFKKLIDRNICPVVLRLIMYMYLYQCLCVKWNKVTSSSFSVSNGVKQGAILSPILFNIYTNDLLLKLKNSGFGCYIGQEFTGAFAYADDIILLCPSVGATKHLLDICDLYAKDHGLKFNAKKSKVIEFNTTKGNQSLNSNLVFNGDNIPIVNSEKHLGHMLSNNVTGYVDYDYIVNQLYKSVNMLMADFGKVQSKILLKLFNQYCSSIYGIVLCDLTSRNINSLCVAWRKSVKRVLRIPQNTHSKLLYLLSNTIPVTDIFAKRIAKFYISLFTSNNVLVQYMAKRCILQSCSNMGRNVSLLEKDYSLFSYLCADKTLSLKKFNAFKKWHNVTITNDQIYEYDMCWELINARDAISELKDFTPSDCIEMLTFLCTS